MEKFTWSGLGIWVYKESLLEYIIDNLEEVLKETQIPLIEIESWFDDINNLFKDSNYMIVEFYYKNIHHYTFAIPKRCYGIEGSEGYYEDLKSDNSYFKTLFNLYRKKSLFKNVICGDCQIEYKEQRKRENN